jgi:hypothetical protein
MGGPFFFFRPASAAAAGPSLELAFGAAADDLTAGTAETPSGIVFETKIAQGCSKLLSKFNPLIGILSQNAGPSRAIRTNPVRTTFE